MKTFSFSFILCLLLTASAHAGSVLTLSAEDSTFFEIADSFFKSAVQNETIQYSAINQNTLVYMLNDFRQREFMPRAEPVNLAYYMNAYNAASIYIVCVQGGMLRESEQHSLRFWVLKASEIRARILQQDSELYFAALSCPCVDCPRSFDFAIQPQKIVEQTETLFKRFVNSPEFVSVDDHYEVVQVSKILKWLAKRHHIDLMAFLNTYRDEKIPPYYKITYKSFDYSPR